MPLNTNSTFEEREKYVLENNHFDCKKCGKNNNKSHNAKFVSRDKFLYDERIEGIKEVWKIYYNCNRCGNWGNELVGIGLFPPRE